MITEIFRAYVKSYKELPKNLYHIQWKFRDEQRPRFGVMRGREFLMKDAYSFDVDDERGQASYNRMFVAYLRAFQRMGLQAVPMRAEIRPNRWRPQPRVHQVLVPDRRKLWWRCSSIAACWICRCRVRRWTMTAISPASSPTGPACTPPRRTSTTPCATKLETAVADRLTARGIEVGQTFYFGDKYSKPSEGQRQWGPDGVDRPGRRWGAMRVDLCGWPEP